MARAFNVNLEWANHNANRKYPFALEATGADVTDEFKLPNDFIIGCYLSLQASHNVDLTQFTLKSLGVFATGAHIVIGYDNGSEIVTVATAMVPRDSHVRNQAYRLGGVGDFVDVDGWIMICQFDNLDLQPAGDWQFDLTGGRLEVDVARPQIRGVSGLRAQNGNELSDRAVGDIILRAGRNVRITPVLVEGYDPVFVFDAISGEGLIEDCVCDGDLSNGPPIRTINKIPPTPDGDFTFLGDDCLEIEAITNGLRFKDICSAPCCGCPELETVTQAMELFGQQAQTLSNFLNSLEARVTQMDQVVLGSRLGDRGCIQCEEE